MNCDDFERHWEQLVANTVDGSNREAMVVHARTCQACGDRMAMYNEVQRSTQRAVESQPLPPGIAQEAADHAYQSKYGVGVDFNAPTPTSPDGTRMAARIGSFSPQTIATSLGALVIGFLLGGGGGGGGQAAPNPLQQIQNLQMLLGRGGRGTGAYEMMMMSQMMNGNGSRGLFPAFSPAIKIIFLVVALMWITRSRIWERLFPAKLPVGIQVARWTAIVAAIVGIARCGGYALMTGLMMTRGTQGGTFGGNAPDGVTWMFRLIQFVDQIWAFSFWLTILILMMTVAEHLTKAFIPQDLVSQKKRS